MENEKVITTCEDIMRDGKLYAKAVKRGGSNGLVILPDITEEERNIRHEAVKKACAEILINRAKEGVYL